MTSRTSRRLGLYLELMIVLLAIVGSGTVLAFLIDIVRHLFLRG